jgi:formimidoylglutamate deiminase
MYIHIIDGRKPVQAREGRSHQMTSIFARHALLPTGWHGDVRIVSTGGIIASIETNATPHAGDEQHEVIVPGMANLHSHAFQRAMAGLAEARGPGEDSFWSWRDTMYRFALTMTPDDVEAVAGQLYCEMLEQGFTRVGEFHYLHHAPDGSPYANIAEMAERIAAAAGESGIGLTLLPVFYARSGFGGTAPQEGQRRFISTVESYGELLEASRAAVKPLETAIVGVAPHSLRAVTPQELPRVVALGGDGPVHIHIAEQVLEVEDCIAFHNARPVEWLLANAPVDSAWCLIHATHMSGAETLGMARSGAVAGLCPITEANLGDGTFNAPHFIEAGGRFGIGSDSNVLIGLADELRQLEYSQRLQHRLRNVLAAPGASTGRNLFERAGRGGAQALGVSATGLAPGAPADFVSLECRFGAAFEGDRMLDAWIFSRSVVVDCVWVSGRKRVAQGRHVAGDAVRTRFAATLKKLVSQ